MSQNLIINVNLGAEAEAVSMDTGELEGAAEGLTPTLEIGAQGAAELGALEAGEEAPPPELDIGGGAAGALALAEAAEAAGPSDDFAPAAGAEDESPPPDIEPGELPSGVSGVEGDVPGPAPLEELGGYEAGPAGDDAPPPDLEIKAAGGKSRTATKASRKKK